VVPRGTYRPGAVALPTASSSAGAAVLIAIGRPGSSAPYAAPLALPQKQGERPPDAVAARALQYADLLRIGDVVAVDVDRHDLPAVLLARASGEPTPCDSFEDAKIVAFELPPSGPNTALVRCPSVPPND
jgi:hypothetical protein